MASRQTGKQNLSVRNNVCGDVPIPRILSTSAYIKNAQRSSDNTPCSTLVRRHIFSASLLQSVASTQHPRLTDVIGCLAYVTRCPTDGAKPTHTYCLGRIGTCVVSTLTVCVWSTRDWIWLLDCLQPEIIAALWILNGKTMHTHKAEE